MYKIMLIDDDPTSLAIGKALLEDEYELSLARSGHQALGALKNDRLPDLILLDMLMPDIDGMEFLKTLKRSEDLRQIPIIFLTGEGSVEKEVQGYYNGAADFLEKPVNPDKLRIKIGQQLHSLRLRLENEELKQGLRTLRQQLDALLGAHPD